MSARTEVFQLVSGGILPQRADSAAMGTLPVRAYRHCEVVTSASGFGIYLFPPISFKLMLTKGRIVYSLNDTNDDWYYLETAVQYPYFSTKFDMQAPQETKGFSPPWLVLTETGLVQVWTGAIVRTAADWSLWIKSPSNLFYQQGLEILEGIVETDVWFGPLFSNFRIRLQDVPFNFPKHHPLFQIVPIPREAYIKPSLSVGDLFTMGQDEWKAYHSTVVLPQNDNHKLGAYAVKARRRRAKETIGVKH